MPDEKHFDELTQKLVGNPDPMQWAEAFARTAKENPAIATDEGTMVGWFSNAIAAGRDDTGRRLQEELQVLVVRSGLFRWEGWAPRPAAYSGYASAGFAWTYGGARRKALALRQKLIKDDPLSDVPPAVVQAGLRSGATARRGA